jgi:hypothetical protein
LLIDDQREFGTNGIPLPKEDDEWEHALTYDAGEFALKFHEPWDVLYLDHDFGDSDPKKIGYGIMNYLESLDPVLRLILLPKKIVLVTSNPVGRKQMQMVMEKLYPKT